MLKMSVRFAVTLALCVLAGWPAVAQQQAIRVEPTPLDSNDAQAKRAAVLVNQILAGDKAAALKTIKAEGDETFANRSNLGDLVDAQIARLSKAKYTIRGFETGIGADVVVLLQAKDAGDANIVVRYNDAKKIVGFAQAQINEG